MSSLRIVRNLCTIARINHFSIVTVSNIQIRSIQSRSIRYGGTLYFTDKVYTTKTVKPAQNLSNKSANVVSVPLTKSSSFGTFGIKRKYGLHHEKHLVLAASTSHNLCNYMNIRSYSNESLSRTPSTLPLDGIWKTLSESAPVEFTQNALVWLHTATGLPWWATIVLATWTLRAVVTVPLVFYQHYILAKYYNLKHDMDDIVKELKHEANYAVYMYKWTEDEARAVYNRSFAKEWQKLIERDNCHPFKSFIVVIVQIPMWITMSAALRNMCYALPYPTESARTTYLELTTGGFGWMMDLTVSDASFVLPVTMCLLNLTVIEMLSLMQVQKPSKAQKYIKNFFRLVTVCMIPLALHVPTATCLYWVSSSAFGIVQNLLIMSPRARRLARIPWTDTELEKPYTHFYNNLRNKIAPKKISINDGVQKS